MLNRVGRRALAPTIPGANGRPRLSPIFVEWMQGLPLGHVTGHGLRPTQELKALGNGVVPQQAALALSMLLGGDAVGVTSGGALLPTPTAGDHKQSRNSTATRHRIPPTGIHAGDTLTDALVPR